MSKFVQLASSNKQMKTRFMIQIKSPLFACLLLSTFSIGSIDTLYAQSHGIDVTIDGISGDTIERGAMALLVRQHDSSCMTESLTVHLWGRVIL